MIVGTIVLEGFVVRYFLKYDWKQSFIASLIGNLVSGVIGTFIMLWAMLIWHLVADNFVPHGTFGVINWIATYILMCFGSVFFETLAIKIVYKEKIKSVFLPMLVGNFLSYAFIAYFMFITPTNDATEFKTQKIKYISNKQKFILLDSSKMQIDSSIIKVFYNTNGKQIDSTGYNLTIFFKKQNTDSFQFDFETLGKLPSSGIGDHTKDLHVGSFNREYKVLLEQKNPDTLVGWQRPIVTDTLIFTRR